MNDDEKGGEGRGLPVGFKWAPSDLGAVLCDGGGTVLAEVTRAGYWTTYDARGSATGSGFDAADGAAAQREAVAALWRVDGFGVGEVRGLVLGDEWTLPVGFALDAPKPSPMALPGLSGLWTLTRVSNARPITVDAVRAPVVEPAPLPLATLTGCDSHSVDPRAECAECEALAEREEPSFRTGCAEHLRIWGRGCETCDRLRVGGEPAPRPRSARVGTDAEHDALADRIVAEARTPAHRMVRAEPAPREPSAPNLHDQIRAVSFIAPTKCSCGANVSRWIARERVSRCNGCGALTDHRAEPPAPTDDPGAELARLLPGLADLCAAVLAEPAEETRQRRASGKRLALACKLLLGERERLAPILSSLLAPSDRGDTVAALRRVLANRDWLRKRESARTTAAAEKIREQAGEIDERDEKIAWLRARVAELEATPPPGTVAALLAPVLDLHAQIGDALDGEHRSNLIEALLYALGDARATLGAPTQLDRAVAEVCALPVEMPTFYASVDSVEDGLHAVDMLIGDHEMSRRDRLAKIARVALAGMLACDAAPRPVTVGVLFIRRGPPEDEYNGVRFRVEARSSSGIMWALVPTVGPMIRLWASDDDLRSGGWERDAADGGKGGA